MSREWCYDGDGTESSFALWERSLENAMNSKRGQKFLSELEQELNAMSARGEGRLLSGYLVADGGKVKNWYGDDRTAPVGCCALGVMCRKKIAPEELSEMINREMEEAYDFPDLLPKRLNIARALIAEIGTVNDAHGDGTDEHRFERMRGWVHGHVSKNGERVRR